MEREIEALPEVQRLLKTRAAGDMGLYAVGYMERNPDGSYTGGVIFRSRVMRRREIFRCSHSTRFIDMMLSGIDRKLRQGGA